MAFGYVEGDSLILYTFHAVRQRPFRLLESKAACDARIAYIYAEKLQEDL